MFSGWLMLHTAEFCYISNLRNSIMFVVVVTGSHVPTMVDPCCVGGVPVEFGLVHSSAPYIDQRLWELNHEVCLIHEDWHSQAVAPPFCNSTHIPFYPISYPQPIIEHQQRPIA
jgi:hypothetical protein